jgi:hypothetical protein
MFRNVFGQSAKIHSCDVLLVSLLSFTKRGQEEISLPEILDSALHVQEGLPLGYEFSRDILYSGELFRDMAQLEESGYIRRYVYTHDSFLPKGYVTLSMLGRGRAEKRAQGLSQPVLDIIGRAVDTSIAQHRESWRLYPRARALQLATQTK